MSMVASINDSGDHGRAAEEPRQFIDRRRSDCGERPRANHYYITSARCVTMTSSKPGHRREKLDGVAS